MNSDEENMPEKRRGNGDLTTLGQTLMPFARRFLGAKGFVNADIAFHWREIVGDDLAGYSTPLKIDFRRGEKNNGVLSIEVPSGGFALELQHREKLIVEKVNAYFGYAAITRIKVLQNNNFKLDAVTGDKCERVQKTLVTAEEEIYIKQLSENVQNVELQNVLYRLGHCVLRQVKSEKNKDEI